MIETVRDLDRHAALRFLQLIIVALVAGVVSAATYEATDRHRMYRTAFEAYRAERDYYRNQADSIIAAGRNTINKEKKHGKKQHQITGH